MMIAHPLAEDRGGGGEPTLAAELEQAPLQTTRKSLKCGRNGATTHLKHVVIRLVDRMPRETPLENNDA